MVGDVVDDIVLLEVARRTHFLITPEFKWDAENRTDP
jgi:hypothetical protein